MTELLQCAPGPRNRWQVGSYAFTRRARGKWDAEDGLRGVGNYRTPLGAFLALRSWRRAIGAGKPLKLSTPDE